MIPAHMVLRPEAMRAVEAAAVKAGVSEPALMENAGAAAAAVIAGLGEARPTIVLCGPGANGGDGYVVARKLKAAGWPVRVYAADPARARQGDAAAALMARGWDGEIAPLAGVDFDGAGLIVDALFGIGLSRTLTGPFAAAFGAVNRSAVPTVALDIPSGVDAATGRALGDDVVRAAATVAFGARKPGHLLFPGRALCGRVTVVDIGLPSAALAAAPVDTFENAPAVWGARLPRPTFATHKYGRGACLVASGPRLRTGAARLVARAALRIGAGVVIVASPSDAADENARQLTAVMVREADGPEGLAAHLNDPRVRACVVGPGCGVGPETRAKTVCVLETSARLVADADALTSFAEAPGALFARLRADDALTPHGGEFARLFPDLDPQTDKVGAARAAAARAGAVVVLKGADTVIASPDGRVAINANAAPDLATAGAGDVLAGFIAGLGAQGMAGFEAAAAGVWLHGEAGSAAGPGLIAEDLPEAIPHVLRRLFSPDAGARAEPSAPEDDGARGP